MTSTAKLAEMAADAYGMQILELDGWESAGIPEQRIGQFRVRRYRIPRGFYPMHGVGGHYAVHIPRAIMGTELAEFRPGPGGGRGRWHPWMVDEPLHRASMADIAGRMEPRADGRPLSILILGLGLGMIVEELRKRTDAFTVNVVERAREVVDLTWMFAVRGDPRFGLRVGDFFDLAPQITEEYDYILYDFLVGDPKSDPSLYVEWLRAYEVIRDRWPGARAFYHGVQPWADALDERGERA